MVETTLLIGHAFWSDEGQLEHDVGWWGASLAAVRHTVHCDGAASPLWLDMRRVVGTIVRQGAACVRLPAY